MQAKEFDDLLRDNIDQGEFDYKPQQWEKLSLQLDIVEEKKHRGIFFWLKAGSIAASVALLTFLGYKWLDKEPVSPVASVHIQPAGRSTTDTKTDNARRRIERQDATAIMNNPAETGLGDSKLPGGGALSALTPASKTKGVRRGNTSPGNGSRDGGNRADILADAQSRNDTQIADAASAATTTTILPGQADSSSSTQHKIAQKTNKDAYNNSASLPGPQQQPAERTGNKTNAGASISLAGGYNYGAASSGYTAAVSVQKHIGKKVFLEGNIGLVNGSGSMLATPSSPGTIFNAEGADMPGPAGMTNLQEPSVPEPVVRDLYYFQFSPSVGYNVHERVSVSVGADMQKLLGNDGLLARTSETNIYERLPEFDLGVTGKTEYNVTSRLKAGLLYRNGINRIVGNRYSFDRDYIQVQLKYTLLR